MENECRFCKSKELVKRGFRNNKTGKVQVYFCKFCKRSYSENTTFARMKNRGEIILAALDLYNRGVSLRKLQNHFLLVYSVRVSHVTILKWLRKYSAIYNGFTDKIKINGSGTLHADEMMININGKWVWLWNVIDDKTKFITCSRLSKRREMGDAKKIFLESKRKLNQQPNLIITDGLPSYPRAIKKVFGSRSDTKHQRLIKFDEKPNNNIVERFHGTVRERTKVTRGFDKFYSAKAILDLFITNYNFIRPHEALNGLTPAEASGVNLHLNGNRWLDLLRLAINNGVEK